MRNVATEVVQFQVGAKVESVNGKTVLSFMCNSGADATESYEMPIPMGEQEARGMEELLNTAMSFALKNMSKVITDIVNDPTNRIDGIGIESANDMLAA